MNDLIRVGMVEDDAHVRTLVIDYLREQPEIEVIITADSVEDFFDQLTPATQIDVLIQDIGLPGKTGLEAIGMVHSRLPHTQIVMFTVFDDSERVFKAFCAGAAGYLLKSARLPDMRQAIRDIHSGMAAMSPSIAKKVVNHFKPSPVESVLSEKERMVVRCLSDGMSYKLIGDRMQVSINTIRSHIRSIYSKLQVNSKSEVISRHLKGEI